MNHELRYGRFTSSKIAALLAVAKDKTSFGKPALTYIKQRGMERRLQRSLSVESNARPLQWGKCCEDVAFNMLPTTYKIISEETIVHPLHPFWPGSPDLIKTGTVADIKCPATLVSFCTLIDEFAKGGIQGVRDNHDDGDTYYWQLVSNAILLEHTTGEEIKQAELIVYVPYLTHLPQVRQEASIWGFNWIVNGMDCELPYLIESGQYMDVNIMAFDIPDEDKARLTECVLKAEALLTT